MTDEAAFLAAVAERPGDPTPRLVYADWLDDRGDPRAELVRIEEEMRTLPADADRYWSLKPRRNELRAACSADWLAALGYGTVYRPVLGPWPGADVRGRFRLLRELVERWYGELLPDAGGRADEVAAVGRRLGRALPAAVREWIAFTHDVRDSRAARRVFRDSGYTFCPDGGPAPEYPVTHMTLMMEDYSEWDYYWAVPTDRLADPDPPVELHYMADPPEVNPVRTVSVFALEFVGANLGGGGVGSVDPDRFAGALRAADERFPVRVVLGHATVYEAEGVLVAYGVMGDPGPCRPNPRVWARRPIPDPAVARWVEALRGR